MQRLILVAEHRGGLTSTLSLDNVQLQNAAASLRAKVLKGVTLLLYEKWKCNLRVSIEEMSANMLTSYYGLGWVCIVV
jgi:hypothetical protein